MWTQQKSLHALKVSTFWSWPLVMPQFFLSLQLKRTELWIIIVLAGVRTLWCHGLAKANSFYVLMQNSFHFFNFFDYSGEQHRAAGCASWGGGSCTEEHLRYGLPQGGQARTRASERHVRPARLLQQYVSTSSCYSNHPDTSMNFIVTMHIQSALKSQHAYCPLLRNG